ncbi:protein of unknown function [Legionella micdadei]|uniref:Uncharacterized protein n=1 Tax=Legionella micdadei TaxID=451 RepID=A0A098GG78_LEGMI|nr:protein of unknown function [Legionella micdadei]SCY70141.1 hypothetical protein SAMN02982997_02562 [Legionella micdadei]
MSGSNRRPPLEPMASKNNKDLLWKFTAQSSRDNSNKKMLK